MSDWVADKKHEEIEFETIITRAVPTALWPGPWTNQRTDPLTT